MWGQETRAAQPGLETAACAEAQEPRAGCWLAPWVRVMVITAVWAKIHLVTPWEVLGAGIML